MHFECYQRGGTGHWGIVEQGVLSQLGYSGALPKEMIYKAGTQKVRQADSEDGGFMGRALEKTVWNLGQKKHGMFTELRET